jgi:hypothetical protein
MLVPVQPKRQYSHYLTKKNNDLFTTMTASTSFPRPLFDSTTLSIAPSSSLSYSHYYYSHSSCSASSSMAEQQGPPLVSINRQPQQSPTINESVKSYSWSNFPIIIHHEQESSESSSSNDSESAGDDDDVFVDYDTCDKTTITTASPPTSPPRRGRNRSTFYDSNDIESNNNNNSNDAVKDDEEAMRSLVDSSSTSSITKQSQSQGRRRSVRFEQHIEIRTYSIILGDHPWCEDGYSIELGNDVLSVDRININDAPSQLHHRSFLERKQLLIDVGGYSEKELEMYLGFGGGGGGGAGSCLSRVESVLTNIVNAAA